MRSMVAQALQALKSLTALQALETKRSMVVARLKRFT